MIDSQDVYAVIERVPLFEGLSADTLRTIVDAARPMTLKKGKVLFHQGFTANGCHIVLDGVLKVSVRDKNSSDMTPLEQVVALVGKGDLIGEMALCDGGPRSASVTALKDTMLAHLSERDFFRLADSDTEIYRRLIRLLSHRLRASNEKLKETQRPLSQRLAQVLLRLAEAFGETLPDGRTLIRHRISQAELGRLSSAARENVNRQLKEWEAEGALSKISSYYCLRNLADWQQRCLDTGRHDTD